MKLILVVLAVLAVVVATTTDPWAEAAPGQPIFSVRNVAGRYSGTITYSFVNFGDPNQAPAGLQILEQAIVNFDGAGGMTGTAIVTLPSDQGYQQCTFTQTGTYTVDENGVGQVAFTLTETTPEQPCDGGASGIMSILVRAGRRHIDIVVPPFRDSHDELIPILGSGALVK